jgi:hypothetical protein
MTNAPHSIKLNMIDTLTDRPVTRVIDISNALSTVGEYSMIVEKNIRAKLERWIDEAGNDQHETILTLINWEMIR